MALPAQGAAEEGEDIDPFHPLRTPVSRVALAPLPSASAPTDTWADAPPPRAPVEN